MFRSTTNGGVKVDLLRIWLDREAMGVHFGTFELCVGETYNPSPPDYHV